MDFTWKKPNKEILRKYGFNDEYIEQKDNWDSGDYKYYCEDANEEIIDQVLETFVEEVPLGLYFYASYSNDIYPDIISISIDKKKNQTSANIRISIAFVLEAWDNSYSVTDYSQSFIESLRKHGYKAKSYNEDWWIIETILPEVKGKLSQNIQRFSLLAKNIHETVSQKLLLSTKENLLIKIFNFTENQVHICSQYLSWFGEFLKNIGITADVSTITEGNKTTLTISPIDKNLDLINRVEELFYQYILFPNAEILPVYKQTPQEIYAYQSLLNQVQFLQNQIQLKDSALRLEAATNNALSAKVDILSSELCLLDNLQDESKYDILNGLFSIPAIQEFGKNKNIKIDLTKLFGPPK